nr:hypothetical protein [Nocardiopsis flavescens]
MSVEEIYETFVENAPHRQAREVIFDAFKLHFSLIRKILASGTLWIDGGFCTHKAEEPKDIDIFIVVDPSVASRVTPEQEDQLMQLLTLQQVFSGAPRTALDRVQPMGGLVDCFLALSTDADALKEFDQLWSSVKGADGETVPGVTKGYLEVSW